MHYFIHILLLVFRATDGCHAIFSQMRFCTFHSVRYLEVTQRTQVKHQ